jgi:hypothetical protein
MKKFHLMVEQARIWATQMGHQGEMHRDEVRKLVEAGLSDVK